MGEWGTYSWVRPKQAARPAAESYGSTRHRGTPSDAGDMGGGFQATRRAQAASGINVSGAGAGTGAGGAGGTVVNPWQPAFVQQYGNLQATPYGADWRQGVAQAQAVAGRDYEGDLRRFAQEDVQRQITAANNQLGSMNMRELALRPDVQADRAKMAQDAGTRASIAAQGMKISGLETMRGMLGSATGADMQRIEKALNAAQAGGGNYNDFMSMLNPLAERFGAAGGTGFKGDLSAYPWLRR